MTIRNILRLLTAAIAAALLVSASYTFAEEGSQPPIERPEIERPDDDEKMRKLGSERRWTGAPVGD